MTVDRVQNRSGALVTKLVLSVSNEFSKRKTLETR